MLGSPLPTEPAQTGNRAQISFVLEKTAGDPILDKDPY